MKVAVLVKYTPQIASVRVSEKVEWPDGEMIVNPFDEYAIEEAIRIKEKTGCRTAAISFGKDGSEAALRDALALGIDEAYLVSDNGFDNLDPQKSAAVLAAAIGKIGDIKIVLTGKQATDSDSAVVAPAVAARLDWPQVGFVRKFESIEENMAVCQRTTDDGFERVSVPLPAIFSVVKEINEPRLPSLKGKMQAKKAPVTKWSLTDLAIQLGEKLKVLHIAAPQSRSSGEILTGDLDQVVDNLVKKLRENQII